MDRTSIRVITILLVAVTVYMYPATSAVQASMIDRIKDIYDAPVKVEELQEKYEETRGLILEQQELLLNQAKDLAEARKQAEQYAAKQEELMRENEKYREQNAELAERNATLANRNDSLAAELDAMREEREKRESLMRRLIVTGVTAAILVLGYFASVRIWRIMVWRRQHLQEKGKSAP
ncbi:hypothetical protein DUZ99_13165 [Xylanibacillus composti]|uniref:Uncharacterized protein n=1 Tax=Xylanibacillus composti TaxID=1572762 RepID=A0A8J4H5A9_9BACL|nr:hypothetical protein [Xylanibacillus composti]MDT9725924.1 hypothetical protein [Xylanibacillus composti]GIQ71237.1 hypothetical protein XYCOK13_40610 [Xylanibacillus composti]